MTRCIIHIGMHKTGSTSIQQSLHGFSDDRFLYARLGTSANHTFAICGMFTHDPARHRRRLARGRYDPGEYDARMPEDLERAIAAARGRTLIISGEGISHSLTQADLVRMRQYFQETVDELAIVGYVRPPVGFLTSAIQQRLRSGRAARLEPRGFYRGYEQRFSKFDEVFGRESVHLWKFDPANFPEGCVVRDFCSRMGIDVPVERVVRVNDSLSRQALALLHTYFRLGQQYGAGSMTRLAVYELGTRLAGIGNDKLRFAPDVMRPILEENRADIAWMEARLGQSLHEELGEQGPGDVRDEADLLHPHPEVVGRLRALLGARAPAGVTGETPAQIALLVHALRGEQAPEIEEENSEGKAASEGNKEGQISLHGDTSMKVTELIARIQQSDPQLLGGIAAPQAEALVTAAFKYMNKVLARTEDGVVNFSGLGRFRIKKVEGGMADENASRTRITFRMLEAGEGSATGRRNREGDEGRQRRGALRGGKRGRKKAGDAVGA